MKTDTEYAKEFALTQYVRRVVAARKTEHVKNESLLAGSPMFFYCRHCGILIERLPEDYLFTPYQICSQCKGLEEQGWLHDAKRYAAKIDCS
jgi:hypothetical protein